MQYCIGGLANVLSDYKETGPSNILKTFHTNCHNLTDQIWAKSHKPSCFYTRCRQCLYKCPCIHSPMSPIAETKFPINHSTCETKKCTISQPIALTNTPLNMSTQLHGCHIMCSTIVWNNKQEVRLWSDLIWRVAHTQSRHCSGADSIFCSHGEKRYSK